MATAADAHPQPPLVWLKDPKGWHVAEILGDPFWLPGQVEELVVITWLPVLLEPGRRTRSKPSGNDLEYRWPDNETPEFNLVPRNHVLYLDDMNDAAARGVNVVRDVLCKHQPFVDICVTQQLSPTMRFLHDPRVTSEAARQGFQREIAELLEELTEAQQHNIPYDDSNEYVYRACKETRVKFASSRARSNPVQGSAVLFRLSELQHGIETLATQSDETLAVVPLKSRGLRKCTKRNETHTEVPVDVDLQALSSAVTTLQADMSKLTCLVQQQSSELQSLQRKGHDKRKQRALYSDSETESEYIPPRDSPIKPRIAKKTRTMSRDKRPPVPSSPDSEDSERTTTEVTEPREDTPSNYRAFKIATECNPKLTQKRADNLDFKVNRDLSDLVEDWLAEVTSENNDKGTVLRDSSLEQLILERLEQLENKSGSITAEKWELIKSSKAAEVVNWRDARYKDALVKGKCWACERVRERTQELQLDWYALPIGRECGSRIQCVIGWERFAGYLKQRASTHLKNEVTNFGYAQILDTLTTLEADFEQCLCNNNGYKKYENV